MSRSYREQEWEAFVEKAMPWVIKSETEDTQDVKDALTMYRAFVRTADRKDVQYAIRRSYDDFVGNFNKGTDEEREDLLLSFVGVVALGYCVLQGVQYAINTCSDTWAVLSPAVVQHIRDYTLPQYGDYPDDQLQSCSVGDMMFSIKRYVLRMGKNSRGADEDKRDLLKMAHYAGLVYNRIFKIFDLEKAHASGSLA